MSKTNDRPVQLWGEERWKELNALEELLRECHHVNRGSGVIERLQKIDELSAKLLLPDVDTGRESLLSFLRRQYLANDPQKAAGG